MIGIKQLTAIRKSGLRPSLGVVLWCSEHPLKRCTVSAIANTDGGVCELVIGADERPDRIDLRALYGLVVVVSGQDEARCTEVAKAAWDAGAEGAITNSQTLAYVGSIEEAANG